MMAAAMKYPMTSDEAEALLDLIDGSQDARALAEVCWEMLDGRDQLGDESCAKLRRLLWMLVALFGNEIESSVDRIKPWKERHAEISSAELERMAEACRRRARRAERARKGTPPLTLVGGNEVRR